MTEAKCVHFKLDFSMTSVLKGFGLCFVFNSDEVSTF